MEHFKIYDSDNPAPATAPLSLSERLQLDGNYVYVNKQHFPILAEDNPAEAVMVHVAVAKRVAIAELEDDQEFTLGFQGVLA